LQRYWKGVALDIDLVSIHTFFAAVNTFGQDSIVAVLFNTRACLLQTGRSRGAGHDETPQNLIGYFTVTPSVCRFLVWMQ